MIIEFTCENFKSFKSSTVFSMERGKGTRKNSGSIIKKYDLLKSALLFGGNANGKTNLINAIQVLRYLILNPTENESESLFVDTFGDNKDDTSFVIKFVKADKIFEYEVIYNEKEFTYEKLVVNNKKILERHYQDFTVIPNQLAGIISNIRCNQNLLHFAQYNNVEEAKLAFDWFLNDLVIVNTNEIPNKAFKLLLDDQKHKKFLSFMKAADFNIIDVEVKEKIDKIGSMSISFDKNGIPRMTKVSDELKEATKYELYCTHKSENGSFQLDFDRESEGTKVFIFIALYFLNSENKEKAFLIDEFDKSFHIELAKALICFINNENQNSQFIMTTHSIDLMDCSLRPDQIWFAEKNNYGESELFSLFDFDDEALKRHDYKYKKRYMEGRLGATQIINEARLLEILGDDNG